MIKHIILFLFIISAQLIVAQTTTERLEQGFRAQEALKYDEAIGHYESLMKEGYFSADLFFNIAMAYYEKNELGHAILYLEKAKRQAPYDKAITTNLELIQNEQIDGLLPLPKFFLKAWWDSTTARLSPNSWGILAILFSLLSALTLSFWAFKKMNSWRKYQPVASSVLFILAVLFFAMGQSRKTNLNQDDVAIITADSVNIFIAPGDDADKDGEVHAGLKVNILDQFENWMKIRLVDGREGWVKVDGIEVI